MRRLRLILAGLAAALVCAPLPGAAFAAADSPAASTGAPVAPSANDLTRAPELEDVSIAPDGKHIVALSSPDGEVTDLVVWSSDNLKGAPSRVRSTHMRFIGVRFLKDDRLLVTADEATGGGSEGPHHVVKTYVTDLQGKSFDHLLPESNDQEFDTSEVVSNLPGDPRNVMVLDRYSGDIYKVDVYSLSAAKVLHGSEKYFGYQVDLKGELRSRQYADFDNGALYIAQQFRDPDTNQWVELFRSYAKDRKPVSIVGFTTDPHVVLVASTEGGDKVGVYAYDVSQKKVVEQEFGHKLFDAGSNLFPVRVVQSSAPADFGSVLGMSLLDYAYHTYWTDPRMHAMAAGVDQALGIQSSEVSWIDPGTGLAAKISVPDGAYADITSWSDDRRLVIVEKAGPSDPGEYYLLTDGTSLALLGRARPWINPSSLGATRIVEYAARDGLEIPAFLTTPPRSLFGPGPYPTLIEPHGGPWARDFLDWDAAGWVQYFASRGYAVLEPQFRGSEGWGQKLWRAGDAEWGQKMQDDLDDGVKWMSAQGIADPKRVAIFGYSYGGYAALAASIRPNGLYQCAISGAGAGDLDAIAEATFDNRFQREFQHPTIKGLDALAHAKEASIPVLLYHGDHDTTVDPVQSQKFAAALKSVGKPVKLVEIKDMGHQYVFMTPDMMLEQLNLVDGFLKGDCKPGGL